METPTAAPARTARCRMTNRFGNRCQNQVIDADEKAPQICARHALEGARLLEAAGALTLKFINPKTRRSA